MSKVLNSLFSVCNSVKKEVLPCLSFFAIGVSKRTAVLLLIYLTFLAIGGMLFVQLEKESALKSQYRTWEKVKFARSILKALAESNITEEEASSAFSQEKKSVEVEQEIIDWRKSYVNKLFFALVLITTVGYGNIAPRSEVGQIVCIFYIFIGIPLSLLLARLFGLKFRSGFQIIYKKTERCIRLSNWTHILTGVVYYTFWMTVFFLLPAVFFLHVEEWSYTQSIYFCFVTLTTIGLGDLVVGISLHHSFEFFHVLYPLMTFSWLVFGLAYTESIFNHLAYLLGKYTHKCMGSKCRKTTAARASMNILSNLMTDLNWQLAKYTPEDFDRWKDLEDFEELCHLHPQRVTPDILNTIVEITYDLKSKSYDELNSMLESQESADLHSEDALPVNI